MYPKGNDPQQVQAALTMWYLLFGDEDVILDNTAKDIRKMAQLLREERLICRIPLSEKSRLTTKARKVMARMRRYG